ncbi:MAG: TetR family transcriptional regulator [Actinomycetes bacterium]
MKAEAVRRSSQDEPASGTSNKIAQTRDRRDSRWDEHRRTRREELVQATLRAVGRHGPGVGMEEIAAEAGTSKTVVYRHFADRTELHAAVCARVAERLLAELRSAMGTGGPPRSVIARAVETYLAFCEADPDVYRFVVNTPEGQSRALGPSPVDSLSGLVAEQAAAVLTGALTAAGRDPVVARPWAHGLVGLVRAAADWWLQGERPLPRTELAASLTDLAWSGLAGVVPPAAPSALATTEDLEEK